MAQIITFGEVLMRLSTPGFARFEQAQQFNVTYAGGEANVAAALAYWGHSTAHVTRFPDTPVGRAAAQYLRYHGIDISHMLYGGNRIAVYFLETGVAMRPSQIVYDRQFSSFAELDPSEIDWDSILKDAKWFHWAGITPALSQAAADACLEGIRTARKYGLTVSGDIFYRSNLWKYGKKPSDILPELTAGTDLVVGSPFIFKDIFGIEPGATFEESCQRLHQAFPQVSRVVDTHRTSVSASHNLLRASMWTGNQVLETEDVEINPIIDRVGGGDAFIAGLIHGLLTFNDEQRALEFGVAASALKHTIEGDALVSTEAEVEAIRQGDTSGRIKR